MKYKKDQSVYFIRLEAGDEIHDCMKRFAREAGVGAGSISGIGAVQNPTLAYYHLDRKQYENRQFEGFWEVVNLSGNLGSFKSDPLAHLHITLGGKNFECYSGHLVSGVVPSTLEIVVVPLEIKLSRAYDATTGLNLIHSV